LPITIVARPCFVSLIVAHTLLLHIPSGFASVLQELHIIIFDEIDAICRQRGSVRDGTGTHDTIVNQLLTKIDGVDALNNILLIGMTNRWEELALAGSQSYKPSPHMYICFGLVFSIIKLQPELRKMLVKGLTRTMLGAASHAQ
jgi:hypothetical protein